MFSHARRLRWSGEILGYEVVIEGVADPSIDIGIPGGNALIGLVDAFVTGDESQRPRARQTVLAELGPEGFVDSATVFGNFEMMNRVAEATGISVPPQALEREAGMIQALGLYDVAKSQQD